MYCIPGGSGVYKLENQPCRNYSGQNFQEVFPRGLKRQLLLLKKNRKARAVLTAEQAVMIFQIKLSNQALTKRQRISLCSVARSYGVSEKAVRDIWKGRTWLRETTRIDPGRPLPVALRSVASAVSTEQISNATGWWDKDQTKSYANADLTTGCLIDADMLVTGQVGLGAARSATVDGLGRQMKRRRCQSRLGQTIRSTTTGGTGRIKRAHWLADSLRLAKASEVTNLAGYY